MEYSNIGSNFLAQLTPEASSAIEKLCMDGETASGGARKISATVRVAGSSFGDGLIEIDELKEKKSLNVRKAGVVKSVKRIEVIVSIALVVLGVVCIVIDRFASSVGADSTLRTIGVSLVSSGIGLLVAPTQEKLIDAAKSSKSEEEGDAEN
ncbi:MAG: hypothetical protein LBB18_03370 [Puniceicoccales bacterium]|jgi:hypothetical protein|nr:hypothetical protein [Puniceicoccales bacterium]